MKEIELLKEAKKEFSRIGTVIQKVRGHGATYKERLENLTKQLPDMLARMALEEGITREEIDEVEETIRLLKDRIDEIPKILKGLEPIRLRAGYEVRDITRQIEKTYQSIKDKLGEGDESPGLIKQLETCAPHIGMVEDAEEFLSNLKRAKAT